MDELQTIQRLLEKSSKLRSRCPDDETMIQMAMGEKIDEGKKQEVMSHVKTCETCLAILSRIRTRKEPKTKPRKKRGKKIPGWMRRELKNGVCLKGESA